MTDYKYDRPENKTVVKKEGTSALTIGLAIGCAVLLGILGYGILNVVDEEPSKVDVELEAPELPEAEAPEVETPDVELPEVEIPELTFEEPEFEETEVEEVAE